MTDVAGYCRELETHLCRRNGGHLIRIVGPAFERVKTWAERGVPLALAIRGVDRYCERQQAKGPARRPVRIEFCEADILELFDDWRRAIGVGSGGEGQAAALRKPSLAAHIERAIQRLLAVSAANGSSRLAVALERAVHDLDGLLATARQARGAERAALVERLSALDRELAAAAASEIDAETRERLRRDVEAELSPFAARMAPDARRAAMDAAFERLVREALKLPVVSY